MRAGSKIKLCVAAAVLGAISFPVAVHAQAQPGGGGGNGDGGRQRGGWDPARMQQMMMDRLKDQLGTSDDEFAALQPKLEKVIAAQRAYNSGGSMRALFQRNGGGGGGNNAGGGGRQRGGFGGPGGGQVDTNSPLYKATQDLQATLDDKDAKPEDLKAKLEAYRAARAKAKDDLTAAQKDLKDLLTTKQEAALVDDGMLE